MSAIEALREEIRRHNRLYYGDGEAEISDYKFDMLMKVLRSLESLDPELIPPDSPTQVVGGPDG